MPPPAQCTIQASRMMARMIRTSHAKNSAIPGMAYPLMVLVLATTASYPPMPDLIDRLTEACCARSARGESQREDCLRDIVLVDLDIGRRGGAISCTSGRIGAVTLPNRDSLGLPACAAPALPPPASPSSAGACVGVNLPACWSVGLTDAIVARRLSMADWLRTRRILEALMGVLPRPARHGVLAIAAVSGTVLLAGMNAAEPAAARGSSGSAVPASSGGARQWVSFYTGPGGNDGFSDSVAVAHSGSAVFVTGNSSSAPGIFDYATVGYNASTGAKLWARRYDGTGGAGGNALAVAVDPGGGRVFVTGYSPGPGSGTDYVTIAYAAATGARLWLSRYDGPVSGNSYADDV